MERPATHVATWTGGFAIAATIILWLAYLRRTVIADLFDEGFRSTSFIAQTFAYVLVNLLIDISYTLLDPRIRY